MSLQNKRRDTLLFIFLVLFSFLALIRQSELITQMDQWVYHIALLASQSIIWIYFWEAVTFFGEGEVVYSLVGMLAFVFLSKNFSIRAVVFIGVMIAMFFVNPSLKKIFALARPVSLTPYSEWSSLSFPSGHAFNSVVLFYFFPRFLNLVFKHSSQLSKTLFVIGLFGIFMIGMSRVFLGAHWLSDVFGGWMLSSFCMLTLLLLLERWVIHDKIQSHDF